MTNVLIKSLAEDVVTEALNSLGKTPEDTKQIARAIAAFAMTKVHTLEGTEKAAMMAYALGDHFVDPRRDLP